MKQIEDLISSFKVYLEAELNQKSPENLYEPVDYIMTLGGKRIRPALLLAGLNLFQDEVEEGHSAAYAIEMFHNFSLVHDDIMDKAPLRRGKETVHKKWDEDTAILSGDVMMILSYDYFKNYQSDLFKKLVMQFTDSAIKICEGQRWDIDFESEPDVSIDAYLKMIEYKTAVLLGCALKMGALIGGASDEDANHLYEFGKNVGISFQIQDDLLDAFGDDPKVGKQIGGDILNNKKTYLYLKSLELLTDDKSEQLKNIFGQKEADDPQAKIDRVKSLFKSVHVNVYAEELKDAYLTLGLSHLDAVKVEDTKKEILKNFSSFLLNRKY